MARVHLAQQPVLVIRGPAVHRAHVSRLHVDAEAAAVAPDKVVYDVGEP